VSRLLQRHYRIGLGGSWCFLVLLVVFSAYGQQPQLRPPSGMAPPSGLAPPTGPTGTLPHTALSPAPLEPDTVLALLSGGQDWPLPLAVRVMPDSVQFGAIAWVVLDFPLSEVELAADSLGCNAAWLVLPHQKDERPSAGLTGWWRRVFTRAGPPEMPEFPAAIDPPSADVDRLIVPTRIYHPGPFQVGWSTENSAVSALIEVVSGLGPGQQPVPVRSPRPLGWRWYLFIPVVLLLGIILWLYFFWSQKRQAVLSPQHNPIPPPAYLSIAQDLDELTRSDLLASGQGRLYLDRLAAITRRYLEARFFFNARAMTTAEITYTLQRRAYRLRADRRFLNALAVCDSQRYRSGPVDPAICRALLAAVVEFIGFNRIEARFTPIPPQLEISGRKCWSALEKRIAGETTNDLIFTGGR